MTHPDCAPNGRILKPMQGDRPAGDMMIAAPNTTATGTARIEFRKPLQGDGLASTWTLAPQRCPACQAVLVIRTGEEGQPDEVACPWDCEEGKVKLDAFEARIFLPQRLICSTPKGGMRARIKTEADAASRALAVEVVRDT